MENENSLPEEASTALRDTDYAAAFEEFRKEFPDVPVSHLDETLWEQVKGGVPLAAAYALKLHREKKAAPATGAWRSLEEGAGDGLYSKAEVQRMSEAEVRQNYARICESMKHW